MLVYRIENWAKKGPYRNKSEIGAKLGNSHVGLERAPAPGADGISGFWLFGMEEETRYYIFGFESLDSLKSWFLEDERMELRSNGFVCTVSEVDEVHVKIGSKQLCYDQRKASFIRHLDLLSFHYSDPPKVNVVEKASDTLDRYIDWLS